MSLVVLMVGTALLLLVIVAFIVVPGDRRRGLAVLIAITLVVAAGGPTSPLLLRAATPVVGGVLVVVGVCTGTRSGSSTVRGLLAVLSAFALSVLLTTTLLHPVAVPLFARPMFLAIALVVGVGGSTPADRRLVVRGLLALAVAEAVLGVVECTVTHQPFPWGFKAAEDGSLAVLGNPLLPGSPVRVSGTLGHPIPYATVLGAAVVAICVRWRGSSAATRFLVLPLLAVAIVLSGSRSVIVGIALALVVLVWTSSARTRLMRVLGMSAGCAVGAVFGGGLLVTAVERLTGSGSYTNRVGAVDAVPGLLRRSTLETVFGSGFGTDFDLYRRGFFPQNGFLIVDNQLVTTLGTEGVVGVVLVVVLFVLGWRRGGRLNRAWIALFATLLFSFDYLGWSAMLGLLCIVLAFPVDGTARSGATEHDHREDSTRAPGPTRGGVPTDRSTQVADVGRLPVTRCGSVEGAAGQWKALRVRGG